MVQGHFPSRRSFSETSDLDEGGDGSHQQHLSGEDSRDDLEEHSNGTKTSNNAVGQLLLEFRWSMEGKYMNIHHKSGVSINIYTPPKLSGGSFFFP